MRRWLGAALAYTRPRSVPVTMVMAMTGWLASPMHARASWPIAGDVVFLLIVHSVLLWGGTNAFNSAEDKDEGPVNLLPSPPPRPMHLGRFGLVLMGLAIVAAAVRDLRCAALATIAVVLSIFYSWKSARWRRGKEIPLVDNLINALGCGAGSFYFGWCTTGAPISSTMVALGLAWSICLFGGMPTAQIFQLRPTDDVTSARNFTAWLGAPRTLRLGAVLFAIHLCVLAVLSTWNLGTCLWAIGVVAAVIHSARWSRAPFSDPYRRMLRQMTVLTTAQMAWALGRM